MSASDFPHVQVALCSPPFSTLTYSLPPWLPQDIFAPGLRVAVPLGKGLRMGVILESAAPDATAEQDSDFAVKHLAWPLDSSPLPKWYMEMASQIALRQTSTPGRILANILPAGLRTTQVRIRFFGEGKPRDILARDLLKLDEKELCALGKLWAENRAEVCRAGQNPLDIEICTLLMDPPWPVRPVAKAQIAMLEYLFGKGSVTRRKLQDDLGKGAAQTLSLLVERGVVAVRPMDDACALTEEEKAALALVPEPLPQSFTLTPHQMGAYTDLVAAALETKGQTRLLFGITGSGKTAIYLEIAREVLNSGRSVLLLAPEVALAIKLWNDAKQALPGATRHLFHGYQSPLAREKTFRTLLGNESPALVIGTRSALFLPVDNVGLIVLDEEHDSSFKQDEGFTYQAKEVAWYRAGQENALLLLGSATPDLKTFHAARQGNIPMHSLTERAGLGTLPSVRLVGLPKTKNPGELLVDESKAALMEVVQRGEQAVILLNRRGYAPLMYCLSCNTVTKCPACDIGLAYHKGRERLLCHYCGYSVPFPSPCGHCKGLQFLPMGEGTEKLEENLAALLPPGTGILRLDRDSTRRPGRMEEILQSFARKEAQVLVGTQMLSKGHHFPDVTLAIVADADLGLNLPDYRAAERTFQLLLQSAGRAGRGARPGTVLIQTRDTNHYCWKYLQEADYEGFFAKELELRQKRRYPPFVRLALIRISFPMEKPEGADQITALGAAMRTRARALGLTLLGPVAAPLPFLKGRRRFHCLIKGDDWSVLRSLYLFAVDAAHKSELRLTLDLDPVNML